ncbi:hypothetical protein M3J09_010797 [Ascochyta lentis]
MFPCPNTDQRVTVDCLADAGGLGTQIRGLMPSAYYLIELREYDKRRIDEKKSLPDTKQAKIG